MARPTPNNPNGAQKSPKKTPEALIKLKQCAALDATIPEMCFYANISEDTYHRWMKKDKKLKEEMCKLREKPVLAARMRAIKGIEESYSNAMDYLSRKRKDEFSPRSEVTGANGKPLMVEPEVKEQVNKALDEYFENNTGQGN